MISIEASKQVGPIYYMVNDIPVLEKIVDQQAIRTSVKVEPADRGKGSHHYIAFLRDLTKAGRNASRWIYGIQIDGDKLSDRYKISPYSFAGNAMKKSYYRLKTLIAYDNGTYTLSIAKWPTMEIPKSVFEELEDMITSDSQGINELKKLEVSEGKRAYRGKRALIRYNYGVEMGGLLLNEKTLSSKTLQYLLKHTGLNETEERIWILDDNVKFISIKGLISGYIAPKGDSSIEETIKEGELPELPVMHY